jgi:hypothetical protein
MRSKDVESAIVIQASAAEFSHYIKQMVAIDSYNGHSDAAPGNSIIFYQYSLPSCDSLISATRSTRPLRPDLVAIIINLRHPS